LRSFHRETAQAVCAAHDDTALLSAPEKEDAPEAFLSHRPFALLMARFPEAERRLLHKMICMQCYARNAMRATRCRKCGSRELRPKAKEARKE
jgi:large subunit ribosomal protein L40e